VDGYRSRLLALGYTPSSARNVLKEFGQLGRWMSSEQIGAGQLSASRIEEFLRARRAAGHKRVPGVRSFASLLDYLGVEGVIAAPVPAPPTPLDELIGGYRRWLVTDRALAPATVLRYENLARRFLSERLSASGAVGVEDLAGADVAAFLLCECARLTAGSAKGRVTELRALFRFLDLQGLTSRSLSAAVPPVAGWRDTTVPAGMAADDVERLLGSCDRSQPAGVRDFAILMLLARLGLRSAEVSRLELGDLDWRAGEIVVCGKARRRDRLPLFTDVGEAVAGYLSVTPQRAGTRRLFLTVRAPRRPIRPDLVGDVVKRACRRSGLAPVGAHRLRHALATQMLRQGATLVEISQVLRHSDLATTAVYAKVDLARLRQVAQPWPGATR
jgi:site-specific recombinase XerD